MTNSLHALLGRSLFGLLATVTLAAGLSGTAVGQSQKVTDGSTPSALAAGAPVGSHSLSAFETVNPYNGGLSFSLPLLTVGGRGGAGYPITLSIDHKWVIRKDINPGHPAGFYPTPSWVDESWGLKEVDFGVGRLRARYGITRNQSHTLTRLTFTAPDGTEYELRDAKTNGTPQATSWTNCLNQNYYDRGRVFVTADGTSATFIADPGHGVQDLCGFDAEITPPGYMLLKDGTRFRLNTEGRVAWMRDRNGNLVTFAYSFNSQSRRVTVVTDSLGRAVTITEGAPATIAYKGFGGVERTLKVHVTTLGNALRGADQQPPEFQLRTQGSLFPGINNPVGSSIANPQVVGSVELPDGRFYVFKYNDYGELARVQMPTGGATEYDYAAGLTDGPESGMLSDTNNEKQVYRRVVERRVYPDGGSGSGYAFKQVYTRPESSATNLGYVEVFQCTSGSAKGLCDSGAARLGHERHYYHGSPRLSFNKQPVDYSQWREGKEYETHVYHPQSGALLRKSESKWEQPLANATWPLTPGTGETDPGAKPNNPEVTETLTTLAETNQVVRQTFSYDRYGNQTDVYEYDYGDVGSGTYGPLVRHTRSSFVTTAAAGGATHDYACDPTDTCGNTSITQNGAQGLPQNVIHLRGLLRAQLVYSVNSLTGAETLAAKSEMRYDEAAYPLFTYDGVTVPGWADPATPARGNVTSVRSFIDAAATVEPEQACPAGVCVETHARYDQLGNVRHSWDARGNRSEVTYEDSYCNDNGVRCNGTFTAHAFAFPTWATTPKPDPTGAYGSASGLTSSSVYDYHTGRVYSTTDANNRVTRFEYEGQPSKLDRIKAVVRADGGRTDYEYGDVAGNIYVRTLTDLDGARRLKSEQHFDKMGRPYRAFSWENQEAANPWLTRDTLYDKLGRVSKTMGPYRSAGPGGAVNEQRHGIERSYDSLGRLWLVKTTADGAKVTTDYSGQRVLVTDQAGKQRMSKSDALGRITEVWEVTPNDTAKYPGIEPVSFDPTSGVAEPEAGYRTDYLYDALGRLRRVRQGTQERFYAYDSLGRLLRAKLPEQGDFTPDAGAGFPALNDPLTNQEQWSAGYVYDENGNLTKHKDARGVVATYGYDGLNRNITVTYATPSALGLAATANVHRFYDNPAAVANGKGRLHRIAQSGTTTSATYLDQYDAVGRPLVQRQKFETNSVWSADYTVTRAYDLAGNVLTQTYPSGRTVSYKYNAAGRLGDLNGQAAFAGNLGDDVLRAYASEVRYHEQGGMEQERFGTATPVYSKSLYNARGQLAELRVSTHAITDPALGGDWNRGAIHNTYSGLAVSTESREDNNGDLRRQKVLIPNDDQISAPVDWVNYYDYDALNRLDTAGELLANQTRWAQDFDYDRWGNRTINQTNTTGPAPEPQFTVGAATNRLGVPADQFGKMGYDSAGNLILDTYRGGQGGGGLRTYDAENRMTAAGFVAGQAQVATYTYDGEGRRVRRKAGNSSEVWQVYGLTGELLAEYAPNAAPNAPQKEYGYRGGELLVTAAPTTTQTVAPVNLAREPGAAATQSSTLTSVSPNGDAWRAVDGSTNGTYSSGSVSHTNGGAQAWWQVDLGTVQSIRSVDVWNRTDCCANDLSNFYVLVSDVAFTSTDLSQTQAQAGVSSYHTSGQGGRPTTLQVNRTGRYVRVQLASANASLTLAEVQVWGTRNLAAGKTTTQSSTLTSVSPNGNSWRAADGNTNGNYFAGSVTHTNSEVRPWWEVDLGASKPVDRIEVWNRTDCCANDLTDFYVLVSESPFASTDLDTTLSQSGVSAYRTTGQAGRPTTVQAGRTGRYVRVQLAGAGSASLALAEVQVWGGDSMTTTQVADVRWLVADQLGTPRMILDKSGSLAGVTRHDYFPFGESIPGEAAGPAALRTDARGYRYDPVRQTFTGYEHDAETELDFAQARYYSATHGRFSSVDPLMGSAEITNPQTFNRYSYVINSPLKYSDPSGLSPENTDGRCGGHSWIYDCGPQRLKGDKDYALPDDTEREVRKREEDINPATFRGDPIKSITINLTAGMTDDLARYATVAYNRGIEERILYRAAMAEMTSWAQTASRISGTGFVPALATAILAGTVGNGPGQLLTFPDSMDASVGASGGFKLGIEGTANAGLKGTTAFPAVMAYNAYVKATDYMLAQYAEGFAQKYGKTTYVTNLEPQSGEKLGLYRITLDKQVWRNIAHKRMNLARSAGHSGL